LESEGGEVTAKGEQFLAKLGIDVAGSRKRRRAFCRPCLDWSERRFHIAGAIGAAIADHCFKMKWIKRIEDSRGVVITSAGEQALLMKFGIKKVLEAHASSRR